MKICENQSSPNIHQLFSHVAEIYVVSSGGNVPCRCWFGNDGQRPQPGPQAKSKCNACLSIENMYENHEEEQVVKKLL